MHKTKSLFEPKPIALCLVPHSHITRQLLSFPEGNDSVYQDTG